MLPLFEPCYLTEDACILDESAATGGKFLTECCWRATLGWETGEHMFMVGAIIVFDSLCDRDCWE